MDKKRLGLILVLLLIFTAGLGLFSPLRGVAQAAGPHLWLSQKVGPPTAGVQVHGYGFGHSETLLVVFDTTQAGVVTSDAAGEFVVRITVPKKALPGTHSVQSTGQTSGLTARTLFLVRTDWSQFGFGPHHAGYNPYENVITSSNVSALTFDWSYRTARNIYDSPAVANGVVYASSGYPDYKLYALDAMTGALKWSYPTGNGILSSPAVATGVVYIGSTNDKLYALDAQTGALKWSYTTGSTIDSTPAVASGVVYIGSFDGYLYALDAVTGALKWSYTAGNGVGSSPAVANGVVYVGSYPLVACVTQCSYKVGLYALDAVTGALKWSYSTISSFYSSPAVANGVVYVSSGGNVYAFHLPGRS